MTAADLEHYAGLVLLAVSAPFILVAAVVAVVAYLRRGKP